MVVGTLTAFFGGGEMSAVVPALYKGHRQGPGALKPQVLGSIKTEQGVLWFEQGAMREG